MQYHQTSTFYSNCADIASCCACSRGSGAAEHADHSASGSAESAANEGAAAKKPKTSGAADHADVEAKRAHYYRACESGVFS